MKSPYPTRRLANQVSIPYLAFLLITLILTGLTATCVFQSPKHTPAAQELVLYNWVEYMPQKILDRFQAQTGVRVIYKTYDSMEEAIKNIENEQVSFDVAVVENDLLPELTEKGLLAPISRNHVPNFKNISPNFRDLRFDPDNAYSIPYNYGTTGLLVRGDLAETPVTRWADLWDPRYSGKIIVREQPTELITASLKSLGYRVNSEDPAELEAALAHLFELKKRISFVGTESAEAVAPLLDGRATILLGWPGDALYAHKQNPSIEYVIPAEGTMLWGDSFVISSKSTHGENAELFLNFLLAPEAGREFIETYSYPNANEVARALIDPKLASNPILFPPQTVYERGEWYLPLSPQGKILYEQIWQRFLAGGD
jgi:spermidine/putrescine transport system substrate-binding protein